MTGGPSGAALSRVAEEFARNFAERGEVGASVSVHHRGREILSLAAGFADRARRKPWDADTPVLVWSTTKGMTAGCVLHALDAASMHLFVPVAEVLPEFGEHGKWSLSFGEVLSHQAGLPVLEEAVDGTDAERVVEVLCGARRCWEEGHGYHPRTLGYLYDEIMRRLSGIDVGAYWARHFAEPLGLRAWIGAPDAVLPEVADCLPLTAPGAPVDAAGRAVLDPASMTARAFASPRGMSAVGMMNRPEHRRACYPSFGGIATARALAAYYDHLQGTRMLPWMTRRLVDGPDRILLTDTAFSAGFMLDPLDAMGRKKRSVFGPRPDAFGHPGAGGSVAFADPAAGLSFAYTMNQMGSGVFPNERGMSLVRALYS